MINVHELVFEYPGQRALDDVSFTIAENSVTALVGPNGAGKTTLMRCVCGLERPLTGTVEVDGIDVVAEPRRSHERIGYLSDFFGLYDALSVRRVLTYAAAANGAKGDLGHAVTETARALGLSDRLDQMVGELSRGLRQRVAIGQAIIHDPKVLILDEPASGLDPEARHELAGLFRKLQRDGMTLMVSSHILAELEAYATDMLVIRGGRIVEHRPLGAAQGERRRLLIQTRGDHERLAALLQAQSLIAAVTSEGDRTICEITGGDDEQARLLRLIVDADVPVVNYTRLERDLQQSYLDSLSAR